MARAPKARGFTIAERRSLRFEQLTMWMVLGISILAAVVSYFALAWLGTQLGWQWVPAHLVPLAIDGFAVMCSVAIVRSNSAQETTRARVWEWVGLLVALGISIVGNVLHGIVHAASVIPEWIVVMYSAVPPLIVAIGVHIFGRTMAKGISSQVLADAPDELRFDLSAGGPGRAPAAARRPAAPKAPATRPATPPAAPAAAPAKAEPETVEVTAAVQVGAGSPWDRMRAAFDAAVAAQPGIKPDAARLHEQAQVGEEKSKATTRRWVAQWWEQVEAAAGESAGEVDGEKEPALHAI